MFRIQKCRWIVESIYGTTSKNNLCMACFCGAVKLNQEMPYCQYIVACAWLEWVDE
jgi:hypothetical protein